MLNTSDVTSAIIEKIQGDADKILSCLQGIREDELWKDFSPHLVSTGNLLLHLIGNISQQILSGLGGIDYMREREKEFSNKPRYLKKEIESMFAGTVKSAVAVIKKLSDEQLNNRYTIQGKKLTGIQDLIAVGEHLAYHTGQIVWIVKYFNKCDLDFYKGVDLNKQNGTLR